MITLDWHPDLIHDLILGLIAVIDIKLITEPTVISHKSN